MNQVRGTISINIDKIFYLWEHTPDITKEDWEEMLDWIQDRGYNVRDQWRGGGNKAYSIYRQVIFIQRHIK